MDPKTVEMFSFKTKKAATAFAAEVRQRGLEAIVTTKRTPDGWLVAVKGFES